jgi:type II secretory pathway pseudopilin PulG
MKQKVRLSIDRSLSGSQGDGEESERLAFNLQPSRRAFTVIELVGVMAIIAIIAAALAPNIIKRIDRAAWQRETSDLNTMANGLVQTILTDKVIPSAAGISNAISKYLDLSVSQVRLTPRGFTRMFLVDPGFSSAISLPWVQTNSGLSSRPASARMMIISTLAKGSTISDTFQSIWNTPEGSVPASWTGKSDDLCIKRLEIGGLFRRVCLLNNDTNQEALYRLDDPRDALLGIRAATNIFVLDGTALSLYRDRNLDQLQLRIIVDQDLSFAYQNGLWSGDLSSAPSDNPGPFGSMVSDFLNVPPCSAPRNYVSRQEVIDQFYIYLFSYWVWSSNSFEGFPATPQTPGRRTVQNAQADLSKYSKDVVPLQ